MRDPVITTGKRGIITAQFQATVNEWARMLRVPPPTVVIRERQREGRATYRRARRTIHLTPTSSQALVAHEFAHHLANVWQDKRGHGPTFRIALVVISAIAFGAPHKYPWKVEYANLQAWAKRHQLLV